jgi:hypothetical protein
MMTLLLKQPPAEARNFCELRNRDRLKNRAVVGWHRQPKFYARSVDIMKGAPRGISGRGGDGGAASRKCTGVEVRLR